MKRLSSREIEKLSDFGFKPVSTFAFTLVGLLIIFFGEPSRKETYFEKKYFMLHSKLKAQYPMLPFL